MNLQIKLVKHLTKGHGHGLGYLAARDTDAEKTVFVADCLVSEHLFKLYEMQFCQIIKKKQEQQPSQKQGILQVQVWNF